MKLQRKLMKKQQHQQPVWFVVSSEKMVEHYDFLVDFFELCYNMKVTKAELASTIHLLLCNRKTPEMIFTLKSSPLELVSHVALHSELCRIKKVDNTYFNIPTPNLGYLQPIALSG